ncbi:transcriptional regulator [Pseudomonas fluvialis]|uniref:Transcriptional regulator n=1 Tax=Pseudomonas fluvialis TaxID=1793966 RepID=A0A7X0ER06_9PSED|nr:FMN-binding negative transcriptional regulator [Pseudomonas fluvialis]MBB6340623.1 transcriptional regulator [Pseudomonas fluvialis]
MYRPTAFRQDDLTTLHAQIDSTGLALLTSNGPAGLQATHLPLLLAADEGEFGTLYGHFARANPHWQDLTGQEALTVFSGPDAYVHPGWYPGKAEHGQVVPTWNYIAVHAWGQVEVFDDADRLRLLLERLTARHEAGRPRPWALDDAPSEYLERMLRAIVGFALPIRRLEGQWKLSQNRQAADRAGVREGLAASDNPRDRELAARMTP